MNPDTPDFHIVLHASEGWLPQLQYEQREPIREVYRHVSEAVLSALYEPDGRLPLDGYWDAVCRPVLAHTFDSDDRPDCSVALRAGESMEAFVRRMGDEHTYADPFAGMRIERREAHEAERNHDPVRHKEVLDDLLYTLNFHAERLSAEDHGRLHRVLMPYVMNVIAAMPLRSARTLLALHDAGPGGDHADSVVHPFPRERQPAQPGAQGRSTGQGPHALVGGRRSAGHPRA